MVAGLAPKLKERGIDLGKEGAGDSTMVETMKGDPDGKYNPHY